MTLGELRAEVMLHHVAPNVYSGRVNTLLNEALRRVSRLIKYYANEATHSLAIVAGQSTYPWPDDFGRLRWVRDPAGGRTLRRLPLRDVDEAPPSSGIPTAYALSGASLTLYPTPSSSSVAVELRYWALPPLMERDSDVPALPEDYHRILPLYALQRSFEAEDDIQMAAYWRAEWDAALLELDIDVRDPSDDGPRQVRSMWEV